MCTPLYKAVHNLGLKHPCLRTCDLKPGIQGSAYEEPFDCVYEFTGEPGWDKTPRPAVCLPRTTTWRSSSLSATPWRAR